MTPEPATVEAWTHDYILSTSLDVKRQPPPVPKHWSSEPVSLNLRPGRPACFAVTRNQPQETKRSTLQSVRGRAELIHKFWHHELQAAELMAWAVLRFPQAPTEFRQGLLKILHDEVRHMALYEHYLKQAGFILGDFSVRDAFWDRVPDCQTPSAFVSVMGMGLEAANLEHTQRFARRFREVGDEAGALVHEQIGREEIAHVRFATRWFRDFNGELTVRAWKAALPKSFSPRSLRGKHLNRTARRKAEMPEEFLNKLD